MHITVDLASPIPPYEQIRAEIAAAIDSRQLAEAVRLPSMRALAADLGVAVGTVVRAYRELESASMVASRRRLGTVVTAPSMSVAASIDVRQAAAELADRAHRAGLSEETALSLLRAALVALRA